jgi:predicted amidophosphoribosyltransferase
MRDIGNYLASRYKLPVSHCLERTTTIQQKTLGRHGRRVNLRGHIRLKPGHSPPVCAVVIDDLMTTGSTLNACAETLRAGGVSRVWGVTLFYD